MSSISSPSVNIIEDSGIPHFSFPLIISAIAIRNLFGSSLFLALREPVTMKLRASSNRYVVVYLFLNSFYWLEWQILFLELFWELWFQRSPFHSILPKYIFRKYGLLCSAILLGHQHRIQVCCHCLDRIISVIAYFWSSYDCSERGSIRSIYKGAGTNFFRGLLSWGIINTLYESFSFILDF